MNELIDTHAHPHMSDFGMEPEEFVYQAKQAGVTGVVCVGTSLEDSKRAIEFAQTYSYVASVGLHPHEAGNLQDELPGISDLVSNKYVVAVGECGLDYYYQNSPKKMQIEAFKAQLELASLHNLALIFHVRDAVSAQTSRAFDDFFQIIDEHVSSVGRIKGVVHSFTSDQNTAQACIERGLYISLNGIMTFTKDKEQLKAAKSIPLNSLLLETDSPFLTPHPYRGTLNNSAHVRTVAEFLSELRGESVEDLARATTNNARRLFKI